MPLLNYTTTIAAHKTIAEIQQMLAKAGANAILSEYDEQGCIVALDCGPKLDVSLNWHYNQRQTIS